MTDQSLNDTNIQIIPLVTNIKLDTNGEITKVEKTNGNKIKIIMPKIKTTFYNVNKVVKNPYINMGIDSVNFIIRGRTSNNSYNNNTNAKFYIFNVLDKKYPHWYKNVYKTDISTIEMLSKEQLVLFYHIKGFNSDDILHLNIYDMREYILYSI